MGWCDAIPKNSKKPNKLERGNTPDLLHEEDDDLIDDLESLGFAMSDSQGFSALSFTEIKVWSEMVGATLSPRASEWMVLMSKIYVGQKKSLDGEQATPPPWYDANFDRAKVSDDVEKMFKGVGVTKESEK